MSTLNQPNARSTPDSSAASTSASLVPSRPLDSPKYWKRIFRFAGYAGAVVAAIVSVLSLITMAHSLWRIRSQDQEARVAEWQPVVVYQILERANSKGTGPPMSFQDIKSQYVTEAATVQGIDIPKGEIQDLALRRILLDLQMYGLVTIHSEGRYMAQKYAVNPRYDRAFVEQGAKYGILSLLAADGGKYDVSALGQKISDKYGLTSEEFSAIIVELKASNFVTIDRDGMVWSAAHPPRQSDTP